jgi:hypothetical protein
VTAVVAALTRADELGVTFMLEGGRVRCRNGEALPPDLFRLLYERLPELREILAGNRCWHCGEGLDGFRPDIVPFADGRAAHLACHEAAGLPWIEEPANDDAKAPPAPPPDPATALIGRCWSCGWITPLNALGTCWPCSPVAPLAPAPVLPSWDDDRAWIARWQQAGPTLAERLPVLEAWLALAPPQPLPRQLAALELARIARQHGIAVEVAP